MRKHERAIRAVVTFGVEVFSVVVTGVVWPIVSASQECATIFVQLCQETTASEMLLKMDAHLLI